MYQRKNQIQEFILCGLDAICMLLSYFLSGLIRYKNIRVFLGSNDFSVTIPVFLLVHISAFYIIKMYEDLKKRGPYAEARKLIQYIVIVLMGISVFAFSLKDAMDLSRIMIACFVMINLVAVWGLHQGYKAYLRASSKNKKRASKILIITTKSEADSVIRGLQNEITWNLEISGLVLLDAEKDELEKTNILGVPLVGNAENYIEFARLNVIDETFIYLTDQVLDENKYKNMILELEKMGMVVQVNIHIPDLGVKDSKRIYKLGQYYVIAFSSRFFDYRLVLVKRFIDIVGSIIGLLLTVVIGVILAPILLLESKGPLFFVQNRVGKNGRIFKFYKFRSMYHDAEQRKHELLKENEMVGNMFKVKNDPRITRVGRFIRKTSIDELPQFLNVLRGEMSLVGTRPPTLDEYEKYESYQKRRLSIKPGITGLWQISGRSNIKDFDEVVQLDLEYIDNWSIGLDIKILFKTIAAVFQGIGAR